MDTRYTSSITTTGLSSEGLAIPVVYKTIRGCYRLFTVHSAAAEGDELIKDVKKSYTKEIGRPSIYTARILRVRKPVLKTAVLTSIQYNAKGMNGITITTPTDCGVLSEGFEDRSKVRGVQCRYVASQDVALPGIQVLVIDLVCDDALKELYLTLLKLGLGIGSGQLF